MTTTAVASSPRLPAAGTTVTVRTPDGYTATGRLVGLISDDGTPKLRVLPADRIERHIPVKGATVTVDGAR